MLNNIRKYITQNVEEAGSKNLSYYEITRDFWRILYMHPARDAGRMLAGWSHEKDSLLLQYCFSLALGQLLSSTTKGKGEARGKQIDGVKIGGEEAGGFLSQWISSRHPFNLRATLFLCSIFPLSFALFSSFFIFTFFFLFSILR